MIGRKGLLSLISLFIVRFLQGIIYLLAVAKFFLVDFGYFQIATSFMGIFLLISTLGFENAHIKIMSSTENQDESFTIFFFIKLTLIIISTITIWILISIQIKNGFIPNEVEQKNILVIVYFDFLFKSLSKVFEISFQAKMNVAKLEVSNLIGTIGGVIFSFLAILVFGNFLLYLIGNICISGIKIILLFFYGRIFKITKINHNLLKKYLSMSLIFLVPVILNTLTVNLGPLFYKYYYNAEMLGVYTVIATIFAMIMGFEETFRFLLIPNFSNLLVNKKFDELKESIQLFEKYMIILNAIIIMGGIIITEAFMILFLGPIYYVKGAVLFYGFLISLLNYPLFGPYSPLLIAAEKLKFYILILLLTFICSLLSWIFLIPIFGIVGIEFGSWISSIPAIIIIRIYTQKHFGIGKFNKKETVHLIVVIVLIITTIFIALQHIRLLYAILITGGLIIGYLLFVFLTKIIDKKDIAYIFDTINPKKLMDYIKNEAFKKD